MPIDEGRRRAHGLRSPARAPAGRRAALPGRTEGSVVKRDVDGTIGVYWRAPAGWDSGARLTRLEMCADILRDAGIPAFVTLSPPEARVLCLGRGTRGTGCRFPGPAIVDSGMEQLPAPRDPTVVLTAGRILDAVAAGLVLVGTLAEVARQLGVGAGPLRVALRELRAGG